MSTDFKLALFGQIYDNEGLLYSYPEKVMQLRVSGQYPAWVNALPFDTRFLRTLVVPGGECFSVRYGKEGLFYSYTRYNPHDSRNGAVSIALYTQNRAVKDARKLIVILRNLMDYVLEKNSSIGIQDAEIEELTNDLSLPYIITPPTQETEVLKSDGFRVWQSEADLLRYLNWSIQKEYTRYKWVHFISAEHKVAIVNSDLFTELRSPVLACYAIKRPANGDTETYDYVLKGASYSVNYKKDGFLPRTITIVAGEPSSYTVEDNLTIRFKPAHELDLKFRKRVNILLFDALTNAPIIENGQQARFQADVEDGKTLSVMVSARGYVSATVVVDSSKQSGPENTIRQNLQREALAAGRSPKDDVYDMDNGGDSNNEGYVQVRKNPLVISLITVILLALLIGSTGGFFGYKQIASQEGEFEMRRWKDSVDKLEKKITQQEDTIRKRGEMIKDLNQQISDLQKENKNLTENIKELQFSAQSMTLEEAEEKAKKYLNQNGEWCIVKMRQHVNGGKVVKQTDAYKLLNYILDADSLDVDKINYIQKQSQICSRLDWTLAMNSLNVKVSTKCSIDKIKVAFKCANSSYNPSTKDWIRGKKPKDGTINIEKLKKGINDIKK